MANNEVLIPIPGRLHSVATEGHVAGADEIYDDTKAVTQDVINASVLEEKAYVPADYSGMGRVVLKKNMVNDVNTLTQEAFEDDEGNPLTNTVFVIQYDFTLGENIEVPANCVLEFEGGSISGAYTITGNDTEIRANKKGIFDSVNFDGTFNAETIFDSWFIDNENDVLKRLFALSDDNIQNTVIIDADHFISLDSENIGVSVKSNTNVIINGSITLNSTDVEWYEIFRVLNKANITISGSGSITGDADTHTGSTGESGHGINIEHSRNIEINDITISKCWGDGIYVGGNQSNVISENIRINGVEIHHCRRQGLSVTYCDGFVFDSLNIYDIAGTSPQSALAIEPNENRSVLNGIVSNSRLNGTMGVEIVTNDPDNRRIANIEFVNCHISNPDTNTAGYVIEIYNIKERVKFENCTLFPVNTNKTVYVHNCRIGIEFIGCEIGNSAITKDDFFMPDAGAVVDNCRIYNGIYIGTSQVNSKRAYIHNSILYGKVSTGKTIIEKCVVYGGMSVGASYLLSNQIIGEGYLSDYSGSKLILRNGSIAKDNVISFDGETSIGAVVVLVNDILLEENTISGNGSVVVYKQSSSVSDMLIDNNITGYIDGQFKIFKKRNVLYGTTRPTLTSREVGYMFFDQTSGIEKPIWYKGGGVWVDSTGTSV